MIAWLGIRRPPRQPALSALDLLHTATPEEVFPEWRQLTEELVGVAPLASVDLCVDVIDYLDQVRSVFEGAARANS